ncbi:lgrD [Symbiodinium sp. CCMP2592]|nr:lgrD [Symbiodinium sp. CCMP2592]
MCSAPGVALGYIGQPQLTAESFRDAGCLQAAEAFQTSRAYRTGDLVRFVPRSPRSGSESFDTEVVASELVLEFLGRADFQVKLRGHRVELGEIEQACCQAKLATPVTAAIVLAASRGSSERRLVAFVAPQSVDSVALRETLTQQLPSYMVPDAIVTRSQMPLTSSGKIDRDLLAKLLEVADSKRQHADRRQPATEMERHVLVCFKEALGMPSSAHLGVDDDFFEPPTCMLEGAVPLCSGRIAEKVGEGVPTVPEDARQLQVEDSASFPADLSCFQHWLASCRHYRRHIPRLHRGCEAPASFGQERFWLLVGSRERLQPGTGTYGIQFAYRLEGPGLKIPDLARALEQLTRRHAPLRTVLFEDAQRGLLQKIRPPTDLAADLETPGLAPWLWLHDLRQSVDADKEMQGLLAADICQGFDLSHGDSDQEWEKPDDEVALARATLAHNVHAHEDESANSALASFTTLEVDDTSMDLRLQEMEAAMKRLLAKGSEMVAVTEDTTMDTTGSEVPTTGDFVPEGAATDDPMDKPAVPTTGDFVPEGAAADDPMDRPEVPTTGDFVPEGGDTVAKDDASRPRPYSALPAGALEEKVFKIEGFPDNFPGIGKKSADWAQQLTKEEIASLFSELKAEQWSRPAVERVLEVYQIYKRQLAQEKMLAAPYNRARRGVGHSSMGQLDPGSTGATLMCPNCFSDWQRQDNKVEGKCKLCQKSVIAVDKGPPSAEIKLGQSSWRMFCGPKGVTWHTDADEAQKEAASVDIGSWAQPPPRPTDQKELSFADQVPMALRLSLAHTVATQPFDEVQFADKEAGDRPHLRGDWQPSQETRAFHPQLAAAMDITKKSSGPVDKQPKKPTEEEFLDHINPQLDVIVEMQAGAQSVEEAKGASILRQLDTEKLRSLLKRNYLQGPGNQGDEFFAAQTSLEEAKASNKRMQDEGSQRSQLLRPVADSIDAWGTQLRAALEMNVFNPECPLKDMELDDIEALKERYLNTKFLLNQSRNPFPASLLQELPTFLDMLLAIFYRQAPKKNRRGWQNIVGTSKQPKI